MNNKRYHFRSTSRERERRETEREKQREKKKQRERAGKKQVLHVLSHEFTTTIQKKKTKAKQKRTKNTTKL